MEILNYVSNFIINTRPHLLATTFAAGASTILYTLTDDADDDADKPPPSDEMQTHISQQKAISAKANKIERASIDVKTHSSDVCTDTTNRCLKRPHSISQSTAKQATEHVKLCLKRNKEIERDRERERNARLASPLDCSLHRHKLFLSFPLVTKKTTVDTHSPHTKQRH